MLFRSLLPVVCAAVPLFLFGCAQDQSADKDADTAAAMAGKSLGFDPAELEERRRC